MKIYNKILLLCVLFIVLNVFTTFATNATESNIQIIENNSQFAQEKNIKLGLGMYGISDISNYSYNEYTNKETLGKIIDDYYTVAFLIDNEDNIHNVKIDHIYERLDFTPSEFYINTEDAGYYLHKMFISDKEKKGTNYCLSDGSGIDILLLEKKILQIKNFNDVMSYLAIDSNRMLPILAALGDAYINSKQVNENPNGLLGLNVIAMEESQNKIEGSDREDNRENELIICRKAIATAVLISKDNEMITASTSMLNSKNIINKDGKIINREKTENIVPKNYAQVNNKHIGRKIEDIIYQLKEEEDYTIGKACIDAKRNR